MDNNLKNNLLTVCKLLEKHNVKYILIGGTAVALILPEIKATIKFIEAKKRKETVELGETKIHFMNYLDLIEDKKVTARKKDLEDIKQLKKIKGEE